MSEKENKTTKSLDELLAKKKTSQKADENDQHKGGDIFGKYAFEHVASPFFELRKKRPASIPMGNLLIVF